MISNATSFLSIESLSKKPSSAFSRISKFAETRNLATAFSCLARQWADETQTDFPSEARQYCSHYYRLAIMKAFEKKTPSRSQESIDRRVISESEKDSAWEAPVRVKSAKPASLSIPGDLAARAAFLARLHRAADLESWVERVLRERVELEESAFSEAKKSLTP
jgi:hypothetical protein